MKKIAYILFSYPKGSETFIKDEINELRKHNEVTIFSMMTPELKENGVVYGKKSKNVKKIMKWTKRLARKSWKDIKFIPTALFFSNIIKNNYDHIHTYFCASTATVSYIVSRETKTPFSFSAHSRDLFVKRESTRLLKEKINHSKFVLVPSEWHRKYMTDNYGFPDKYHIIPNSVRVDKFRPIRTKKLQQVIFIGRNLEKKGLKYLKEAIRILGDGYNLVCIGGGVEEKELIKQMNASKIFVMPSIIAKDNDSDGLPTVVMEAMACGLPIISTNIRALPEMVDGCGLTVDEKNPQQLADFIKKLMKNNKMIEKFSKKSRKRAVEKFDVVNNTKKLVKLMEE